MRTTGKLAGALAVMVTAVACSSGSPKVLVQDSQSPPAVVSGSPTAGATASSPGPTRHAVAVTTTAAPRATRTTVAPTRTPAPATAKATPKATSSPKQTATTTTACTTKGPTTTMQVGATPYQFSPSSITINRCDAVKAVYADSSGAPHTWQGKGWSSGPLSGAGQSYTYRFTSSGTFSFYCSYHQSLGMTGTVTVR